MISSYAICHSIDSQIKQHGLMVVISSPSGAGKSTIMRLLRKDEGMNLALSVSVTTRSRRPSEVDGVHYHFITVKDFEHRRNNDELIEWAEVHGNYYATLRETVEDVLQQGQDMLFDIDYQGAAQLQQKMPENVVSIFILPPSMKELQSRLHRRSEDSEQVIELRLGNARVELQHWQSYDYILINDNLDCSLATVKAIIQAERLKRYRRPGLKEFVHGLMNENPKSG